MLFTLSLSGQSTQVQKLLQIELELGQQPSTPNSIKDIQEIYAQNLHDVFYLIFHERDSSFEHLKDFEEARIEAIETLNEASPWKGFLVSEIKLQWAFIKIKYGEEWGAFWSLRSANKTIEQNKAQFPDFQLNYRTSGLLNILFGVTPENYQWIFKLFGMKGSVNQGIDELNSTLSTEGIHSLESSIVLGMIYSHLFENFQMSPSFIQSHEWNNMAISKYFQGIILSKSHQAFQARALWTSETLNVPFANYLIGETYFQEGNYESAIRYYQQFVDEFEGITYQKDALLKIALSFKALGDEEKYSQFISEAKISEANKSEIDKNAQKILDQLPDINMGLLKLRFAIDGGFNDQANLLLDQLRKTKLNELEKIELTYREARLAHIQAQSELAIEKYRTVISQADLIEETYFAPNSFLQLGYLQQQLGNIAMAKMYFEKVLTFKKHPYKESLDSKANVAISRLDASNE